MGCRSDYTTRPTGFGVLRAYERPTELGQNAQDAPPGVIQCVSVADHSSVYQKYLGSKLWSLSAAAVAGLYGNPVPLSDGLLVLTLERR